MTTRDKVAHLLRRFGLGASKNELDFYEKLGVDGAIDRLVNYEKVEDHFPVHVYEFSFKNPQGAYLINPPSVMFWWTLRLMVTQRPLQEKLALFWHDHFAVSAGKVDRGPFMYEYLKTITKNANGNFRTLLFEISKDPAMIMWLDNDTNVKGRANENFAREVMELFTMGIGNYTETDILEAARAFTGWTYGPARALARSRLTDENAFIETLKTEEPFFTFVFRPALHDTGTKTVLGITGNLSGEDVLDILVRRPETANYLTTKLWTWFAYPNPEPKVIERLSKTYFDSNFEIKPILLKIAESDEFWSDKCVRKQVKNPVDFTVAAARQLGIGPIVMQTRSPDARPIDRVPREIFAAVVGVAQALENQGMRLLFPPDVAGWDWGPAWISTATMVERIKVADTLFQGSRPAANQAGLATLLALQVVQQNAATSPKAIVEKIAEFLDASLPADRMETLTRTCEELGGPAALSSSGGGRLVHQIIRLIFATPEFHFC